MSEQEVFESLATAAAETIIERLRSTGLTEEQIGEWLTYNFSQAYQWAEELLKYTLTPEFEKAVIAGLRK